MGYYTSPQNVLQGGGMLSAKHERMCRAWMALAVRPHEELRKRIDAKARNARGVAAERERKKTPQQRDPRKGAWAGIVCVKARDISIEKAVEFFELMHVTAAGFHKEGYLVVPDAYLEGFDDDRVFIAGVEFIRLGRVLH